jgi:molybdopterin/thiamine biosynthesis adenylyltransferase
MKNTIAFPEKMFTELKKHLLQNRKEQLASILCGINKTENQTRFLCKEIIKAGPEDLEYNSTVRVRAKKEYRKRILTACLEENLSILDCHSHPFSSAHVNFSSIDDGNDFENLTYISEKIPEIHCGSMVFSQNDFKARIYNKENQTLVSANEIKIIGQKIQKITNTVEEPDYETFDRQILLFGKEGQRELRKTSVAIIGGGGTGSFVSMMLTRLGVEEIINIDPDNVEISNLNRLIGATPKDINHPKAEVLKRYAETYSKTRFEAVNKNILDPSALERIKDVDIIFFCTDNQSSRMILNDFSVKYLIPFIDLGAGILTEKGYIEAGGQVRIGLPDAYCLACIDGINYAKAGEELLNQEDKKIRSEAGYIQGHNIPNPSVISLNGTIASLAVTEFLTLITGIRNVNTYITYDMQSHNIITQTIHIEKDEKCPVCGKNGIRAMGDLISSPNLLEEIILDNIPQATGA